MVQLREAYSFDHREVFKEMPTTDLAVLFLKKKKRDEPWPEKQEGFDLRFLCGECESRKVI